MTSPLAFLLTLSLSCRLLSFKEANTERMGKAKRRAGEKSENADWRRKKIKSRRSQRKEEIVFHVNGNKNESSHSVVGSPFFLLRLLLLIVARRRRSANLCCGIIYPPRQYRIECVWVSLFGAFDSFSFTPYIHIRLTSFSSMLVRWPAMTLLGVKRVMTLNIK